MSKVRATVVKVDGVTSTTKQIYDDAFSGMYDTDGIIQPPHNIKELKKISEYSSILQQCIEAMTTNIACFGFTPEYSFDYRAAKTEIQKKADIEWEKLKFFLKYLSFEETPETIISWALADREKAGAGYIEVLRNGKGEPCSAIYMECEDVRVTKYTTPVEVMFVVMRDNQPVKVKMPKKFRKFVQLRNGNKTFFKEFGDPRFMNSQTGEFTSEHNGDDEATEVLQLKIGPTPYGKPRYLGNLISLYGARKAEELNYYYFKQGRHVPAAIVVENGQLTDESYAAVENYMNEIQGVENSHKFLLLEAEGIDQEKMRGEEDITPVKVQIKSLAEMLQQDALFLEYDTKTRDKLRSSFRLPPLYTGESQDYNKSTAQTAKQVTEEQVFVPQRNVVAGKLTTLFCQALDIHYVSISLKGPTSSDPLEKAKALAPFITNGSLTPNDPRDLVGEILGKELEPLTYEGADEKPLQLIVGANKGAIPMNNPVNPELPVNPIVKSLDGDVVTLLKDLRDTLEDVRDKWNR
ncbi:phage portal protein [Bacillus sp. HY001]|uniref:phage portal protein n=1 Tax=Bacillus sp. HY001 TaxID=2597691 RepID=UPI001184FA7F|nr:phage portal protein [Bacillus sp. HY001]TSI19893.1 phage portal protein [Bacillus sp. HY001]